MMQKIIHLKKKRPNKFTLAVTGKHVTCYFCYLCPWLRQVQRNNVTHAYQSVVQEN